MRPPLALRRDDARYPARLRDLADAPDPLWVDGDVAALAAPAVAIVGTRRMTAYGERVARELAMICARADRVVVSGLAQGIDSAAHGGALDAGGRTVAVLGEGIGVFVATLRGRRRPLLPRIRAAGALVSEYAPAFPARAWTFAKRNATIAALAEVVVVVEAGERSGALITAADARRLGRALFAVPGPLTSSASVGTNGLIARRAARALTSVGELAVLLGAADDRVVARPDPLVELLGAGPLGADEIARLGRLTLETVAQRTASLLLEGLIEALPDGRFARRV